MKMRYKNGNQKFVAYQKLETFNTFLTWILQYVNIFVRKPKEKIQKDYPITHILIISHESFVDVKFILAIILIYLRVIRSSGFLMILSSLLYRD